MTEGSGERLSVMMCKPHGLGFRVSGWHPNWSCIQELLLEAGNIETGCLFAKILNQCSYIVDKEAGQLYFELSSALVFEGDAHVFPCKMHHLRGEL